MSESLSIIGHIFGASRVRGMTTATLKSGETAFHLMLITPKKYFGWDCGGVVADGQVTKPRTDEAKARLVDAVGALMP